MLAFQFLSYFNVTKTSLGLTETRLTQKHDYHVMWLPSYDLLQCLQHAFGYIPPLQGPKFTPMKVCIVYQLKWMQTVTYYCLFQCVCSINHARLPQCLNETRKINTWIMFNF